MPRPDASLEAHIAGYARDVQAALGSELVSLALYGSAAGEDWIAGRSDVNSAVIVKGVTLSILEALAPIVARFRPHRFALPLVADREYLRSARDTFPMEFDDIRRQHRVLAGKDVFAHLDVERSALRRQCEHEVRGKLVRLRALFLEAAGRPEMLEPLMADSLKSFLVVLRHIVRLRDGDAPATYAEVLAAGERVIGSLPIMRRVLDHRTGKKRLDATTLRVEFGAYLAEVDRIVAALEALDA
jgi:hypothetical protein